MALKSYLFCFASLFLSLSAFSVDAPMFRGNVQHTGVYDATGVASFSNVKWKFHTTGQVISSPAVVGATIYFGGTDGFLYAVDRTAGTQRWRFEVKSRIASSPAVSEGVVYFSAYDGEFYAVDAATGQLKWKFQTSGERRFAATHLHGSQPANEVMPDPWDCFLSSPVVWNGGVYFGSGDGNVYALSASSGALLWKFKTGNVVHASPAIAGGVLFIGSWDSFFYALDAGTGKEKWRFKTGDDPDSHNQTGIQSSAAVADGVVYFGCRDSHLYALDAETGQKKWAFPTNGSWVLNSPAVKDGEVYFATSDTGLLYSLDAKSGSIVFSLDLQLWPTFSSPALAGDMLYVGTTAGVLHAVDLTKRKVAWTFATEASKQHASAFLKADGRADYFSPFVSDFYDDMQAGYAKLMTVGPFYSSPVVVDNVIYVGGMDGNLYALNLSKQTNP